VVMPESGGGRGSRKYKCTAVAERWEKEPMTTKTFFAVITTPLLINVVDFAGAGCTPAGGRSRFDLCEC
jgi:hypothetical protein